MDWFGGGGVRDGAVSIQQGQRGLAHSEKFLGSLELSSLMKLSRVDIITMAVSSGGADDCLAPQLERAQGLSLVFLFLESPANWRLYTRSLFCFALFCFYT